MSLRGRLLPTHGRTRTEAPGLSVCVATRTSLLSLPSPAHALRPGRLCHPDEPTAIASTVTTDRPPAGTGPTRAPRGPAHTKPSAVSPWSATHAASVGCAFRSSSETGNGSCARTTGGNESDEEMKASGTGGTRAGRGMAVANFSFVGSSAACHEMWAEAAEGGCAVRR